MQQMLRRHACFLLTASLLVLANIIGLATSNEHDEAEPKLTIDQAALRDTIISLLRDGTASADGSDNGYTEAAQEYLEYMQSLLSNVKSPSEVYVREQLADLETLDGVLAGLEAASGPGGRLPTLTARLVHHLVKGPARQLLLGAGLEPATSAGYAGSELAARLTDAAGELRRFLDTVSASLTDDLRQHSAGLPAGRTRDYLDAVLDRVLELEGKKVRLNVEFPNAGENGNEGDLGEPRVSRVPDDEEDDNTTSSSTDADDGGRSLFDQVLSRRAAASVAAQLVDGGPSAAAVHIGELRRRRYQPAGMEALLEAIEQCLKLD